MSLEDAYQNYCDHSGKASDVSRQLAFAALAVVWIFKVNRADGSILMPHALVWPAAFAVTSLAFDLLQYVYAAAAWGYFHRRQEKRVLGKKIRAEDVSAPRWINWPSLWCFWPKLAMVVVSYGLLLRYLIKTLLR